jgi:predicted DNA-binding protein
MNMEKMTKQLRIRLSAKQFKSLSQEISKTQQNKSSLVRTALENYFENDNCRVEKQGDKK